MTTRTALTHPEKTLFPGGVTKQDVASYYESVADRMLAFLEDRPLVMQRFPDGIEKDGFYQKNAADYFPDWIRRVQVPKQGGTVNHVLCNDLDTLLYLVNHNTITFHTWLSKADALYNPDLLVFDLDPPAKKDARALRKAALDVRDLLRELGLNSFVQTSGSRGFHIDVPLDREHDFDTVGAFAMDVANTLVARDPELYTTEFRKKKRGNRIFIDTLRNAYAQTAVAPYSLRPKRGAPAATPLEWHEVEDGTVRPDQFNLKNMRERLRSDGDPWRSLLSKPQSLDEAIRLLERFQE